MKEVFITEETISRYESYLRENEKAKSTIGKYVQAVRAFGCYLRQAPVTKAGLLAYRETLQEREQAGTVNTKISALNSYLDFAGLPECRIKFLKVQRKPFIDDDRELTKAEYGRLLLGGAGAKESETLLYHAYPLRHGPANQRAVLYHRGGGAPGKGGDPSERKKPHCNSAAEAVKEAAALREDKGY